MIVGSWQFVYSLARRSASSTRRRTSAQCSFCLHTSVFTPLSLSPQDPYEGSTLPNATLDKAVLGGEVCAWAHAATRTPDPLQRRASKPRLPVPNR